MEVKLLILVVEDEHLIGLTVKDALQDGGYAVRHVASGDEAIAFLEQEEPKPCAVITDIRLGTGPDGWAVARRARELNSAVPVVYMSGDSAQEHSARGVPRSLMLQKPFAPAQVVTAISTLLNEAQMAPD